MNRHLTLTVDADGIALITMDTPGRSVNVLSGEVEAEFAEAVERVVRDSAIVGAVITSAKQGFVAGYDLHEILRVFNPRVGVHEAYGKIIGGFQRLLRRIETSGKPWAAAINGAALGGGLEVCLACHYRVMADDPATVAGLPEVKVGLLPGAGGTQRLPRLTGIAKALPLLLEGTTVDARQAQTLGLVNEVVAREQVVDAARRWILTRPVAVQPWDRKGFRIPGGTAFENGEVAQLFMTQSSLIAAKTLHNYPAPAEILSCVFEGSILPIDRALEFESQCFARLATGPVSRNVIRTMFVHKGRAGRAAEGSADVYASRCFGTYTAEGCAMLAEGVDPALIESAGRQAGMPAGPLAALDEARFYECPHDRPKRLRPGLRSEFEQLAMQPEVGELKKRLLYVQALEAARCFEEGIVRSAPEADLGSVLGWGFPEYTGGTLSLIDTIGARAFVEDCRGLAQRYGHRYSPPKGLVERAEQNEPFHSIDQVRRD